MRDIFEMACEVGFPFNKYGLLQGDDNGEIDADKMFKALEALIRADEREACAKVCEESASYCNHPFHREALESGAFAIRARNKE